MAKLGMNVLVFENKWKAGETMKIKHALICLSVLCVVILCSCNRTPGFTAPSGSPNGQASIFPTTTPAPGASEASHSSKPVASSAPSPSKPPALTQDSIQIKLKQMTTNEKIGQMVLAGIDGTTINAQAKALIQDYQVGGIIFYKINLTNTRQTIELVNSLKESNSRNTIPLWLSLDEEGGRVTRLPDELHKFPTNAVIGQANNEKFSFAAGSTMGLELKAYGMNMDFAPVLDINSNPDNPVIGNRSFGANASVVSKLGVQTMKGLQSQSIVSVVKHFPGHGDTSVDSHIGLPVVQNDLNRLRKLELVPFAEAIKNKADAVMVAHILLPKIDAKNPASFSKTIITGILRKELGFQGLVISDDMTMGAIATNYDLGEAAVKAVQAGTDVILVGHEYEKEVKVILALRQAVKDKRISMDQLNTSVTHILKLKNKYGISDQKPTEPNVAKLNAEVDKVMKLIQ
jgi:beta-N-acetylhexosaminidase